jgi:tetratricopeptide (TPR) repeat protein
VNRPRVEAEVTKTFKRVFDRLERPSRGAYLGRISIASISDVPEADELAALAMQAGDSHPDIREEAFIYAVQSVMIASRTDQTTLNDDESRDLASQLYSRAVNELSPYPTKVLGEWIELSQQTQDFFMLGEAIRSLDEHAGDQDRRLRDALEYLLTAGIARQQQSLEPEMLAETANRLAAQLALNEQFSTAQFLYEEGLRIEPEHIELNNSYGYHLLERGEQAERAIGMIEFAYSRSPNSAHIADSMGWARYKQGRLTDDTDPETGRVDLGAVTLLKQALALAEQQDETGMTGAFTADHYGDALWAAGQREGAITAWNGAATRAETVMERFVNSPLPLHLELELQNLIEQSREKVRAASEDRRPDIQPYEGMPSDRESGPQ